MNGNVDLRIGRWSDYYWSVDRLYAVLQSLGVLNQTECVSFKLDYAEKFPKLDKTPVSEPLFGYIAL